MKIYIIRHGETDSNKVNKLMGQRVDESLNQEGIRQAEELSENLIGQHFDIIFTSPLKRALETAQIISEKIKVPILEKKELLERDFGTLSGKSWDEMSKGVSDDSPDFKKQDFEQYYNYRPYGGESVEDVKERLLIFIDEIKNNYSDKKVLIIAHGGILKLAHFLFKEDKLEATPANASLYEFEI